jgi:hypothetical protein
MSCQRADVHAVTIRKAEQVAVVARGHPVHRIASEGRSRRLIVHPVPAISTGEVFDARYGRVVHTAETGRAE